MQESIFYNKEQLKIIRNYGWIHLTLFKFGVAIIAWLASIGVSFWMISSGYFSSIYLLEKKDDTTVSQAQMAYTNKQQQVSSIQWLQWILLNWNINITEGSIIAQEALLTKGGITLPRKTNISTTALDYYIQGQTKERFSSDYMNGFFQTMLVNPASDDTTIKNPPLFMLWGSLKDIFGLECTTTNSKSSFVCTSYIKNFLKRFYLYDLSNSTNEINIYFSALSNNSSYKKGICDGLLMNGNFVTSIDTNLSDLFRNCGGDDYNRFILLRDFLSINRQLWMGYIDTIAYNNKTLNEYKLFSIQQLLYREITNSSDVKSLVQSYLWFLREVLIKEEGRQDELLSVFTKSFAYWFNMNILSPYFKDENSKMEKGDRTSLNADMLTINYWDSIAGFKWLQEQSLYSTESVTWDKKTLPVAERLPLRDLFIQSYLPANFNLYSVETGDNENTLIVKWVDLKTNYEIKAKLRYQNLQLSVIHIDINTEKNKMNTTLSDFINTTIESSKTSYSLTKTLALIYEYKDFANKPSETLDFCDQVKFNFQWAVLSCEPTIIELSSNDIWIPIEEPVTYTFYLTKGVLTEVKVDNELLSDQILANLDLSNVDANSTLLMMKNIYAYKIEDNDTWFGLKEYLTISEVIEKYLWDGVTIEPANWAISVKFTAGWIGFIANYDSLKRELNPISINFTNRNPIIVQGLTLTLKDENIEKINNFLSDPLKTLKELNPALVERYFGDTTTKQQ